MTSRNTLRCLTAVALAALAVSVPLWGQSAEAPDFPDLRRISGGIFLQGSPASDPLFSPSEGPVRTVDIRPFRVGVTEVTVGQFRAFVDATGYLTDAERDAPVGSNPAAGCFSHRLQGQPSAGWVAGRSWQDPGYPQGDDHPVVCVSWRDAQAYVAWLTAFKGGPFRLLSESEFEFVMRDEAAEPGNGSDAASPCVWANLADASLAGAFPDWTEVAPCDDGYAFTAPVGVFPANGFGVYGLAGNASEWTQDCWHDDYQGASGDGVAWQPGDAETCAARVLRGGDFVGSERQLRATHRTSIPPAFRTYHAGFRVAAAAE